MINTDKKFDIQNYLGIGLRRKWYIIIPFIFSIIISFGVYKYLPKGYKSTTLILVQPQRVPESYVRPTLTDTVADRLTTISQEILSRTRLEKIIHEFNLYADMLPKLNMEEIVDLMRTKIEVKVQRQNAFSISFEGTEPKTVMSVTNELASIFIEENLKFRESRVEGTADFIKKELQTVEENLKKKEDSVRRFKEKNMGQLPQQLEANLRILERLQQQFKTTSDNLRAAEDRNVLLQNQIEQLMDRQSRESSLSAQSNQRNINQREDTPTERIPDNPLMTQLDTLRRDLKNAESKYTKSHPDIVDLKRKIAALEPIVGELLQKQKEEKERRLRELMERQEETNAASSSAMLDPATERLITQYRAQLKETQLEAKRLKEEMIDLKEQIVLYQRRIEETPKREQEMVQLNRDYDLIKIYYQSLVDKKYQSQMAENLERKQQGEQFMVLDPARLPEKPFKPNRNRILAIGALFGVTIGLGLAWLREFIDQSFHEVSDLETYLGLPVLTTIQNLNEEKKAA
jgi:polysaccharide chain length determinant protein (PEP-CTERM system associated)